MVGTMRDAYGQTPLHTTVPFNMPPAFKSFTLALIQLGKITSNKQDNLQHARDMILKAANNTKKPDLIVLPVCAIFPVPPQIIMNVVI
jgi:hypothetical protein